MILRNYFEKDSELSIKEYPKSNQMIFNEVRMKIAEIFFN